MSDCPPAGGDRERLNPRHAPVSWRSADRDCPGVRGPNPVPVSRIECNRRRPHERRSRTDSDSGRRAVPSTVRVPTRYRYGLALAAALAVLVASVVDPPGTGPTPTGPFGLLGADKYSHAAAYATVAWAFAWARRASTGRALLVVAAVAAAYGAGIELLQATIPARSFEIADGVANAVGAILGIGIRWLGARLRR